METNEERTENEFMDCVENAGKHLTKIRSENQSLLMLAVNGTEEDLQMRSVLFGSELHLVGAIVTVMEKYEKFYDVIEKSYNMYKNK